MKNDQITFYDKLNDSIDFYKTRTNRLVVTATEDVVTATEDDTIRQVYLTRENAKDLVEYLQDYLRHTEYLETETDEKSTEEPVSALPDRPIDIPNGFEFISGPYWILREVQKEQSIFKDYRA